MPGRFTLTADKDELKERFNLNSIPADYSPRYNVSPTQRIAIILDKSPNEITFARWGFKSRWFPHPIINARSEEITENRVFSKPFQERRCIIPADGYYEWKETKQGKIPFRVVMKDESIFSIAGLWEEFENELYFATITAAPNKLVSELHDRMPAILKREDEDKWLKAPDRALLRVYPENEMKYYPVSREVNSSLHDKLEYIAPLAEKFTL